MRSKDMLRDQILTLVKEYSDVESSQKKTFKPGNRIPYCSRVYDEQERMALVDSALDFWLTAGRFAEEFEKAFPEYLDVRYAIAVNSGSSANLVAFATLTSPLLKERQMRQGDEVITVAAAFPTTVAPIIQHGMVPVFVDVTIPQYNIDVAMLEDALSEKTKAVFVAHTLGNPFDLKAVKDFCDAHGLWLIEDNCDALGAEYDMGFGMQKTGTIGDIGTSSFYPAHQMTMGEGGAVYTNDELLYKIMLSMRDWGRDCVCPPGQDNTCMKRFEGQYGELPLGYDHKYVYSHFGYNLKITDMQAAIGVEQLKKLPRFVEKRRQNWQRLRAGLEGLQDKLILPEYLDRANPCWFGFLMTVKDGLDRDAIVSRVEGSGVQTRMLFAGNLIKHPCFDQMRSEKKGYRIIGNLANTDRVMNDSFWVGVYPGMTEQMIDYMVQSITKAVR